MKSKLYRIFISIIMMFLIIANPSKSFGGGSLIVCHKDVPKNELSTQDVKLIFLGKNKTWGDDQRIQVVVLVQNDLHNKFIRKYMNRNFSQYKNVWKRLLFTGKGTLPKYFNTTETILNYVSNNEGAIGFIPSETVIDSNKVKILSVK